jgi:hypothetical protein
VGFLEKTKYHPILRMSSFQINNFSLATYGAIGLTSVVLALITVYDNFIPEGTETPPPPGTDSAAIFNSLVPTSVGSMFGTIPQEPEKKESANAADEAASSSLFGTDKKEESGAPSIFGTSDTAEAASSSLFGTSDAIDDGSMMDSLMDNVEPSATAPSLFETAPSETEKSSFVNDESEGTRGGKKRKSNKSTKKKR